MCLARDKIGVASSRFLKIGPGECVWQPAVIFENNGSDMTPTYSFVTM